jgi:hypothetical protein
LGAARGLSKGLVRFGQLCARQKACKTPKNTGRFFAASVERWQVNAIEFYDNNFFTQEARIAEFAERISPLGLAWWGEARIDTLLKCSDNTWRSMRASGLKAVFMGAEAASAQALQCFDQGGTLTPQKTLEIAAKTKLYGILPEFSFMVGRQPVSARVSVLFSACRRKKKKISPNPLI